MAWDLRPGMLVVCVDDRQALVPAGMPFRLERGTIYTIHDVMIRCGRLAVQLAEQGIDDLPGGWWMASRFRPVSDSRIASLRALLNSKPADHRLPAEVNQ